MLEESRMDKKSLNRSSQPQSRASAIDCKKNSELTNKPWPRNNKKREGPNNAPKNETNRKNAPAQRGRGQIDRRPRARGTSGYVVGGTQNTRIEEDEEPELGSVFVPGSKKQNLNHLLNFMYPSRRGQESRGSQPQRRVHHVSYQHDHDLYLRANCQFVVKEEGDYKANLLDPDVPVKWEQVEEIVVRSTGRSECPICLGPPAAGRVGRCGHVYCWACVLHYAATHEKQPPPCPVCTTPLQVKDMKPTRMVQWESPSEEVTMRLVRRLRGSTTVEIAPPRGAMCDSTPQAILPLESVKDAPYSKFFTASKQQVHEILKRERGEIQNQIMAEIDTTEIVFLEQALDMLKLKEDTLDTITDEPAKVKTIPVEAPPIVYEKQEISENKIDWFDVTEDGAACIDIVQGKMEELDLDNTQSDLNPDDTSSFEQNDDILDEVPLMDLSTCEMEEVDNASTRMVNDVDKENQAKYFYFYQAEDGQQIFLNSLNVRVLNASWGALAAAPPFIRGRVVHRETLSLSEQTRKHMPYTAHLPLHCSFDIVELDLQPPYVTAGALNNFADELDRRARARARRERDERRRERAYRRAMEGPPKPDFSSELLFPAPAHVTPSKHPPVLAPLDDSTTSAVAMSPPSSGPSFATMASTSGTWRVRKPAPAPPPPPDADEVSAPRSLSLSDAIEAALHAAPSSANKKNKKTKQKVLFATGMQRAG
ncbi:E3 ubiquitin-protein ligase RNF10 [Amyelois transitella]|uniref:E3 ubiquitin-protein ligase RNF10 n=1 Tax=Amyelois transitella TaxID=680683 RepID=UPI0029900712|nr:E3 ubiquitin-protein ligase RNF10 [Amyelois transitella]